MVQTYRFSIPGEIKTQVFVGAEWQGGWNGGAKHANSAGEDGMPGMATFLHRGVGSWRSSISGYITVFMSII